MNKKLENILRNLSDHDLPKWFGQKTISRGRGYLNDVHEIVAMDGQILPESGKTFEIEHIIAKERQSRDKVLSSPQKLESLGNKAILEKGINIRAADYRFTDKFKYYKGYESHGRKRLGTINKELLDFTETRSDFLEADVDKRFEAMVSRFMSFVENNGLLK